jgi:hypothetical protein
VLRFKQQIFILHFWDVQDQDASRLSGEDNLLGLRLSSFLLCPCMVERERGLWSLLLIKALMSFWGPTPMTLSKFNHLPKACQQISSH